MKRLTLSLVMSVMLQLCYCQKKDSIPSLQATLSRENPYMPIKFRLNKLYVPTSLIVAGLALNSDGCESPKHEIVEERNEHLLGFKTHIDDYLQFSPLALAYSLDAFGVESRTDIRNRTAILIKGELGMLAVTHLIKSTSRIQRPDHSSRTSFPSGHTAQAFAVATFLSEEYKDELRWMPYVSYGIATSVGALRMANNKHYISDVLVGAGIGILSMKLSYWTHKYSWGKKRKTTLPNSIYFP